jgi:hypothetical protein
MVLTGYIYDNQNGYGVPFATVTIVDENGKSLNQGTYADDTGYFSFDSDLLDTKWILVTSQGYNSAMISPAVFKVTGDIGLERNSLLPYTFTKILNKEYWPLWILGGGVVILLLTEADKRKKVGKVEPQTVKEWVNLAVYIGIPLILIFAVVIPILKKLGIIKSDEEKAQSESDKEAEKEQGDLYAWNGNANHTYNQNTLESTAIALRNITTDWWNYKFGDLPGLLAYIVGMTAADAQYFLGSFVNKNGQTAWQWYREKFQNSVILTPFGWGSVTIPVDYSAHFKKVGITEDNYLDFDWEAVVGKFIDYLYKVAGMTKQ